MKTKTMALPLRSEFIDAEVELARIDGYRRNWASNPGAHIKALKRIAIAANRIGGHAALVAQAREILEQAAEEIAFSLSHPDSAYQNRLDANWELGLLFSQLGDPVRAMEFLNRAEEILSARDQIAPTVKRRHVPFHEKLATKKLSLLTELSPEDEAPLSGQAASPPGNDL